MNNVIVFKKIVPHVLTIHQILKDQPQEVKDNILRTIAGDLLHDVSKEARLTFLTKYEGLREKIIKTVGDRV